MNAKIAMLLVPIAAVISLAGFLIVVAAMWISGRRDRRRKPADVAQRRAA